MNVQLPLLPVPETVQFAHHPLVLEHKDHIMKNILTFWELNNYIYISKHDGLSSPEHTHLTAGGFVVIICVKEPNCDTWLRVNILQWVDHLLTDDPFS